MIEIKTFYTHIPTGIRDNFSFPPSLSLSLFVILPRRIVPPFVASVSSFFWDNALKRIIKKKTTNHVNLQKEKQFFFTLTWNLTMHTTVRSIWSLSFALFESFSLFVTQIRFCCTQFRFLFCKFLIAPPIWSLKLACFHAGPTKWSYISSVEIFSLKLIVGTYSVIARNWITFHRGKKLFDEI